MHNWRRGINLTGQKATCISQERTKERFKSFEIAAAVPLI
jgi:hypothetical protein